PADPRARDPGKRNLASGGAARQRGPREGARGDGEPEQHGGRRSARGRFGARQPRGGAPGVPRRVSRGRRRGTSGRSLTGGTPNPIVAALHFAEVFPDADLRIPLQEVRQERRGDPESGRSAAREVRVLLGPLGEARLPELVPAPWRRMVQQRLQLRVRFIWLVRLV